MNRSFRAPDRGQMGNLRLKDYKDEDLALFREMRKREKERNNLLLLQNSDEFDAPLGPKTGSSPIFSISTATPAPARKTGADDFLNSENDKSDYDWLLTPPGTPLFPSLEMEQQKTAMSQLGSGTPKARPTALKSRLANPLPDPPPRSNLSRPTSSSPGLNTSTGGTRRPTSSSGPGSRPSTPTNRPTLNSTSRPTLTTSSNKPNSILTTSLNKLNSTASSKAVSKPTRSSTPTPRPISKPTIVPQRSSTPIARSTAPRSSTPTTRPSIPPPKTSTSRASTPTRRPPPTITHPVVLVNPAKKLVPPPRSNSPTIRPKPWKPSEMPGFSLDAPPNLRTTLPDNRPPSATRGRPGAPNSRSSSIESSINGRVRRQQSCSPSRRRPPNGLTHTSGSSVPMPAVNRLHAKANDNSVTPGQMGTKMVERVVNMRKLVPPKREDNKHSPHSNLSGKSLSSPDSSGFGRTLSKKSLDMAIRHMDIRRTIPGNLRPLMTNIPASSLYSVRSGPSRSRTISVSDSPLATSSNASSEVSVNNALCRDSTEDDVSSNKGIRSPSSLRGR